MNRAFRGQMNNTSNSQNGMQDKSEHIKLDKIKESWYAANPPKLYDICINILVKNINLLLVRNNRKQPLQQQCCITQNANDANKKKKMIDIDNDDNMLNATFKSSNSRANNTKKLKMNQATAAKHENSIEIDQSSAIIDINNSLITTNTSESAKDNTVESKLSLKKFKNSNGIGKSGGSTNPDRSNNHRKRKYNNNNNNNDCGKGNKLRHGRKKKSIDHSPYNQSRLRYILADHVGPLPKCICESLIKQYSKYYLSKLGELERDEYFKISSSPNNNNNTTTKSSTHLNLVSYYDLLMALSTRPDKCSINVIDYRQCIWSSSTLEQRLISKLKSKWANKQPFQSQYFKVLNKQVKDDNESLSLSNEFMSLSNKKLMMRVSKADDELKLRSLRSKQRAHLFDTDINRMLTSQHSKITSLDICPCKLTNKTILLINKYTNKSLKSLRIQNCCNWQLKLNNNNSNQAAGANMRNHHNHQNEYNNPLQMEIFHDHLYDMDLSSSDELNDIYHDYEDEDEDDDYQEEDYNYENARLRGLDDFLIQPSQNQQTIYDQDEEQQEVQM